MYLRYQNDIFHYRLTSVTAWTILTNIYTINSRTIVSIFICQYCWYTFRKLLTGYSFSSM